MSGRSSPRQTGPLVSCQGSAAGKYLRKPSYACKTVNQHFYLHLLKYTLRCAKKLKRYMSSLGIYAGVSDLSHLPQYTVYQGIVRVGNFWQKYRLERVFYFHLSHIFTISRTLNEDICTLYVGVIFRCVYFL